MLKKKGLAEEWNQRGRTSSTAFPLLSEPAKKRPQFPLRVALEQIAGLRSAAKPRVQNIDGHNKTISIFKWDERQKSVHRVNIS
jgi:hypothetical protein